MQNIFHQVIFHLQIHMLQLSSQLNALSEDLGSCCSALSSQIDAGFMDAAADRAHGRALDGEGGGGHLGGGAACARDAHGHREHAQAAGELGADGGLREQPGQAGHRPGGALRLGGRRRDVPGA